MTSNHITKFFFLPFLIVVVGNAVISSSFIENGAAQQPVDNQQTAEPLIVFINLQRIGTQLNLTEYSLDNGDLETAFEHAYVPHSVTFPVLKPILSEADSSLSKNLEGLLTDLPIKVRASATAEEAESNIKPDIVAINDMLNTISNSTAQASVEDSGFFLQTAAVLLEDAVQSYQLSNASDTQGGSDIFNIQNSLGLINSSMASFERVANSIEEPRREEIRSFYRQMQEGIRNDIQFDTLASVASAIERDFSEDLNLSSGSESGSEQAK
jgi:high-affinity iron transporter